MIEKIVLDFLQSKGLAPVYMEDPTDGTKKFILVEKTGGGQTDHINSATIAIQCFGATLYEAALLNQAMKDCMEHLTEEAEVFGCYLNTDYNYTNTARKQYRYQAVYNLYY